jgi:cell division transport system ATP-binding protein
MAATERDVRDRDARDRDARDRDALRRYRAAPRMRAGAHPAPVRPRVQPGADTVVEFRGVSKLYGPGGIGLERATFAVNRQEMVFLVGATGSGKSTIMRLLIKELEPTEGTIRVAGRDLGEIERKKVPYYRRNVGVVFQDFKLLPTRTVYDNIAYALQVTGAGRKQIRATLPDILRLTGLSTKLHNYPHQLSGGEQQRVAVARAFAGHPPLLLADEPTGNLDPETSIGIMQLLYRINRAGTTVIVASHDNEMVDRMRRRVIELRRGRIVRDEASGLYGSRDENTDELGQRLRQEIVDTSRGDVLTDRPGSASTCAEHTSLTASSYGGLFVKWVGWFAGLWAGCGVGACGVLGASRVGSGRVECCFSLICEGWLPHDRRFVAGRAVL